MRKKKTIMGSEKQKNRPDVFNAPFPLQYPRKISINRQNRYQEFFLLLLIIFKMTFSVSGKSERYEKSSYLC